MTVIPLTETGPAAEWALTLEQGRRLAASGVVSAVPSPYVTGHWRVAAAGKVGAVRIGDVEIHIAPKLHIARLLFLAGYSRHGGAWRSEAVSLTERGGLVPALAQALWRQTQRAIHQGLLPGYIPVEESSPVLRGRLRESEQLHRHHGLPLPLEIRHDEFTVDIPENQILRAACERMLTVPRVDAGSQRMLRRLLRDFADVTPLARADPVPGWQPTRLNARYHSALRLAEIVLRATSAEHAPGDVAINGFLFDLAQLFEDFVTVALREELAATYGGRVTGQARSSFDEAARVTLRPDIVWRVRSHPVAVVDAKYKAVRSGSAPNADLYQMLAYCVTLGLHDGHLVYAEGHEPRVSHAVRRAGVRIHCHAVDLDREPPQLLARMRELAGQIAAARVPAAAPAGYK